MLHAFNVNAIYLFFRTDNTNDFSSLDIWWALQCTTPSLYGIKKVAIFIDMASMYGVRMTVDTGVGRSSFITMITSHEVSMVLQLPSCVARLSC